MIWHNPWVICDKNKIFAFYWLSVASDGISFFMYSFFAVANQVCNMSQLSLVKSCIKFKHHLLNQLKWFKGLNYPHVTNHSQRTSFTVSNCFSGVNWTLMFVTRIPVTMGLPACHLDQCGTSVTANQATQGTSVKLTSVSMGQSFGSVWYTFISNSVTSKDARGHSPPWLFKGEGGRFCLLKNSYIYSCRSFINSRYIY